MLVKFFCRRSVLLGGLTATLAVAVLVSADAATTPEQAVKATEPIAQPPHADAASGGAGERQDASAAPAAIPPGGAAAGPASPTDRGGRSPLEPWDRPDPDPAPAGETIPGPDAATLDELAELVDELAAIAAAWNPAGRAALAVRLPDGSLFGFNEHRPHVSASAAKPIWAAAAIAGAGVEAVEPLAHGALAQSSNYEAGNIIDLVGIDAVNTWTGEVAGLADTNLAAWRFGGDRVSRSVLAGGSRANLITAADLASFYARLRRGDLLSPAGTAALESWLRDTPRGATASEAVTGALLTRLPETVSTRATHKTGWLPPYCCTVDLRLLIDGGVVPLPDGGWFAMAAITDRVEFYNLSLRWVGLAACRVYVLLADDGSHRCERSGDGVPRPDLWRPPPEPDPEADLDPDPGTEVDSETEAEADPDPGTGVDSETEAEADPDPGTGMDSETEAEADPDPGTGVDGETGTDMEPDTGTDMEPDPLPEPEPAVTDADGSAPETPPTESTEPAPETGPQPEAEPANDEADEPQGGEESG